MALVRSRRLQPDPCPYCAGQVYAYKATTRFCSPQCSRLHKYQMQTISKKAQSILAYAAAIKEKAGKESKR